MDVLYADRLEAGHELARALDRYRNSNAVVLGLARGGVAVGFAIAEELDLPLQVLVVRKIGAPGNPELAMGAASETGALWLDHERIATLHVPRRYLEKEVRRKSEEAKRRREAYEAEARHAAIRGRPVIVVDDGMATGSTALVAVRSARELGASRVILAAPVASESAVDTLAPHVDQIVVPEVPSLLLSIGSFYERFDQVSDDEVNWYLRRARSNSAAAGGSRWQSAHAP